MALGKLVLGLCGAAAMVGTALGDEITVKGPPLKKSTRFVTLSEDGGGQRGLIEAAINHYLNYHVGMPPQDCVDLVAGTSTGGLNGLLLALGVDTQEILDMYATRGREIFNRGWWKTIRSLGGCLDERYDRIGLDRIIQSYAGKTKLSEINSTRVVLTGVDFSDENKPVPIVFDSMKAKRSPVNDWYAADAAATTSAAPTFFEPVKIFNMRAHNNVAIGKDWYDDNGRVVLGLDGGVAPANNPAGIAIARATQEYPELKHYLVSIGTGEKSTENISYEGTTMAQAASKQYNKLRGANIGYWAVKLPSMMMDGASHIVEANMEAGLGTKSWRLQTDLQRASDAMDDYSPRQVNALISDAKATIRRFGGFEGDGSSALSNSSDTVSLDEVRFHAAEIMHRQHSAMGNIIELFKDRAPVDRNNLHIDTASSSSSSSTSSTDESTYTAQIDEDLKRALVGYNIGDDSDRDGEAVSVLYSPQESYSDDESTSS